jgi:hypothetical protein
MKTRSRYNEQTELLKSAATLANAELKTKTQPLDKVFSYQSGKIYLTG